MWVGVHVGVFVYLCVGCHNIHIHYFVFIALHLHLLSDCVHYCSEVYTVLRCTVSVVMAMPTDSCEFIPNSCSYPVHLYCTCTLCSPVRKAPYCACTLCSPVQHHTVYVRCIHLYCTLLYMYVVFTCTAPYCTCTLCSPVQHCTVMYIAYTCTTLYCTCTLC